MTKKVFLFIVEGFSDKEALEGILSELVNETLFKFEVINGDITSEQNKYDGTKNIKTRINSVVTTYIANNVGITLKDIEKVIILTDIDGCYLKENKIKYCENDTSFRYENDGIYTDRIQSAVNRNIVKSHNLNTISTMNKTNSKILEVYYFSCNLDHVLHGERNLKKEEKINKAIDFSDKYTSNEAEFINFIFDENIAPYREYDKSWLEIKKDDNSLKRSTNLNVFFIRNEEILNDVAKKIIEKLKG